MPFIIGKQSQPASGGSISLTPTGFTVHVFDTPGADNFITNDPLLVDILVVGGGGGSGYSGPPRSAPSQASSAGGGGAGSVLKRKWQRVNANTTYPVITGSAGYSQSTYLAQDSGPGPIPAPLLSTPGGDTIFNSPGNNGIPEFRAPGGAHGGECVAWGGDGYINPTPTNNPFGSGGGGSIAWGGSNKVEGGIGANEPGFGFNGGPSERSPNSLARTLIGGGGGGAGSAGQPGGWNATIPSNPEISRGGDGLPISDFTENPLDYAGVGGSGNFTPSPSSSGIANGLRNPQDINSSTHYGRGATCGSPSNRQSQDGVVIIKYL